MGQNRRRFLQSAATITALSSSRVCGANDTVRVGGIGTGGRCRYLLNLVQQSGSARVVAVCDVYEPRRAEARSKIAPDAQEYGDYRALLERKDIDAVVVGSPDHWHVPMTIDAVRAGKDVYVEKPVTHSIEEGPLLERAVEQTRRIVQIGYQQRSWDLFQMGREIVASGKLGKVTLVLASWNQNYLRNFGRPSPVDTAKLDWKAWLGNAPAQPFVPVRFLTWRWFWDFGGGHLTDLYSHWADVIHWFMAADKPRTAVAMGDRYVRPDLECPDTMSASWQYPEGFQVTYTGTLSGHLEGGTLIFRGTQALLRITREGLAVYPEGVLAPEKTNYPEPLITARASRDGTVDHVNNFLDCVRTRKPPNASPTSSVAAARVAHLGNRALKPGKVEA